MTPAPYGQRDVGNVVYGIEEDDDDDDDGSDGGDDADRSTYASNIDYGGRYSGGPSANSDANDDEFNTQRRFDVLIDKSDKDDRDDEGDGDDNDENNSVTDRTTVTSITTDKAASDSDSNANENTDADGNGDDRAMEQTTNEKQPIRKYTNVYAAANEDSEQRPTDIIHKNWGKCQIDISFTRYGRMIRNEHKFIYI